MIRMEVAVDHGRHVVDREARLRQRIRHAPRLHLVVRIELVVPEPKPGIEQQHPTPMPDRVSDDDAHLASPRLIGREPELPEEQRHDVSDRRPSHGVPTTTRRGVAERAGFEPATGCPEPHFQCGAIVH